MKAYIKVEDTYPENKKIVAVGPLAMALHLAALAYCNRNLTDGFLPTRSAKLLIDVDGFSYNGEPVTVGNLLQQLIDARLLEVCDGGYMVHDYLEHQSSKEQVETVQQARTQAGSRGGRKTQLNRKQTASNLLDVGLKHVSSKTQAEEEEEEEEELTTPQSPPPKQLAPGQTNIPPQVQQDIALQKHLLASAATLFTSGKLTKAHEGVLAAWFTGHKRQLTSEIVASGIEAAATYTEGDSLNYLLAVMEREITDPGRGKPTKSNGKARDSTPNLKAPVPPTGYSWDQNERGEWKAHEWSEDTQSYPYGCATVGEALNITAERRQEYIRRRETGKGRGAAA